VSDSRIWRDRWSRQCQAMIGFAPVADNGPVQSLDFSLLVAGDNFGLGAAKSFRPTLKSSDSNRESTLIAFNGC